MREIGGEVEAAVMAVIWRSRAPMTVREMLDALNGEPGRKPLAYTTVLTVMTNLAQKQLLDRHPVGRAFRYSAAISRDDYAATVMDDALSATGDRTAALLRFAERLDDAERLALMDHVRRLRRRRG